MEIPIGQPQTPDIFSYGFDANLNRAVVGVDDSRNPLVYNAITDASQAQTIQFGSLIAGSKDNTFGTAPDSGLWLGAEKFANAPFQVDMQGNLIATSATINGYVVTSVGVFGGTGTDGALSISSGTTTIDLGGASVVIKNYTSISITGTGALAFTNPHAAGTLIILKSQGAVTITSGAARAIDIRSMGSSAGTGGAVGANGNDGTQPNLVYFGGNLQGLKGSGSNGGAGGGQVTAPAVYENFLYTKAIFIIPGAGGGGGAGGTNGGDASATAGANGGRGSGSLLIECKGALNFSGTIDASGTAGSAASAAGGTPGAAQSSGAGGGGGGGSGGQVYVLYNTLTANTGTITVTGGDGGNGGAGGGFSSDGNGAAGGGGSSGGGFVPGAGGNGGNGAANASGQAVASGGAGGTTGSGSIGSNGSTAFNAVYGGSGGGGGGGAAGYSLVAQNTIYV